MSDDDNKISQILDDLNDLNNLLPVLDEAIPELNEAIPELNEAIPELNEAIPELNERIDINEEINISLDKENTSETVEQQLVRTHHEEPAIVPELVPVLVEEDLLTSDPVKIIDDKFEVSLTLIESSNAENLLNQQQQELMEQAEQQRSSEIYKTTIEQATEIPDVILEGAWQKVERLLMENLPPQISGAFLQLLNSRIDENKQHLIDELSLLEEDSILELLEALDVNQGF